MDKKETAKLIKNIDRVYPGKLELSPDTVDMWHRYMKNQSYEHVMQRLDRYVIENKFPPSVADLFIKERPERRKDYILQIKQWEQEASGPPKL